MTIPQIPFVKLAMRYPVFRKPARRHWHGIRHYFDAIVYTDEVERGKEHPDIYLAAARRLGAPPENCVVFEDMYASFPGIRPVGMVIIDQANNVPKVNQVNNSTKLYFRQEKNK
jgi:beta-phosphoglucomutase-like phosphatase (HAD superfamily)